MQAAAGVSGPQKWELILPSSARVSLVTHTAVIAVRYPELDNVQNDLVCFGNYLFGEQATSGGFLPLFWDAPSAYMHAATDIGSAVDWLQSQVDLSSDENSCLAVLHNRNKMVATFGNSEWVTQSDGAVQSKSVTSCAGMTAHFVLLAQTKVGFLSGGRSRHMKELSEKEVLAQLEEAYARATVALARAQKLCIIMGPLDMRGLPGAATVIGCLKYGAGVCGVNVSNQAAELLCDVIIIHGKPINPCIGNQDRMETFSFDVPLLDPTGDFSGPRAPSSFLTVEDVWITNYRLLSQTSHISRLNGFNDRGTPTGREPASKHLERLLEGCCMEIFVRNTNPDLQLHFVRKFAKDLVCLLSIWLRQFLRCLGMYWIILARSSMIQRLSPCSYLFSGSTPFTERCLNQLPGIDLASLWS